MRNPTTRPGFWMLGALFFVWVIATPRSDAEQTQAVISIWGCLLMANLLEGRKHRRSS